MCFVQIFPPSYPVFLCCGYAWALSNSELYERVCPQSVALFGTQILFLFFTAGWVLSPELPIRAGWRDAALFPSANLFSPTLPTYMTLTMNYGISCHPTVCSHPPRYCNSRNNATGWITWLEGGCLREAGGGRRGGGGVEGCFLKAPLP